MQYSLQLQETVGTTLISSPTEHRKAHSSTFHFSVKERKQYPTLTLGGLHRCIWRTTEMIHTHVAIQKPYLLWIRNPRTLKFFHVFKNLHHIAQNIKSDTVQGDTLQLLQAISAYVYMRIEEKQTRAPSATNVNAWQQHTAKADSFNS